MTEQKSAKSRKISPLYILMWLLAGFGVFICAKYVFHIYDRLSALDGFDEANSRWLLPSNQPGDWYWKQYKLDLIERVFIYFSFAAMAGAAVTLLLMCLFKSKKAAIIWAVLAPVILIVFLLSQGELFECFNDRNIYKNLIIAIVFQLSISCAIILYSFNHMSFLGASLFIIVIVNSYSCGYYIGKLAIHREESIGWNYASMFIIIVMTCITHLRPKHNPNEEQTVQNDQLGSTV